MHSGYIYALHTFTEKTFDCSHFGFYPLTYLLNFFHWGKYIRQL